MGFISNPPPPLFFLSQVKPAIPLSISRWFYGIGGVLVVLWLWIRDNWTSCMLTLINMLMLIIWLNDILGLNFLWSLMELGWRRRCDGCGSEEIGHRGRLMVPGKDFEWISEEISRYLFVVLETLLVPTICSNSKSIYYLYSDSYFETKRTFHIIRIKICSISGLRESLVENIDIS